MSEGKLLVLDGGKSASIAETQKAFAEIADEIKTRPMRGFVITMELEDGSVLTAINTGTANLFTLLGGVVWAEHRVRQRIED